MSISKFLQVINKLKTCHMSAGSCDKSITVTFNSTYPMIPFLVPRQRNIGQVSETWHKPEGSCVKSPSSSNLASIESEQSEVSLLLKLKYLFVKFHSKKDFPHPYLFSQKDAVQFLNQTFFLVS